MYIKEEHNHCVKYGENAATQGLPKVQGKFTYFEVPN